MQTLTSAYGGAFIYLFFLHSKNSEKLFEFQGESMRWNIFEGIERSWKVIGYYF